MHFIDRLRSPIGWCKLARQTCSVRSLTVSIRACCRCRLRLAIPTRRGGLSVLVEVVEVLPRTHMVDLQKVRGSTGGRTHNHKCGAWAVWYWAVPAPA
jgi:hypothetical protein